MGLQDTEDLATGHPLDLGDSVGVTKEDADLGRRQSLLSELADVLLDLEWID